MNETMLTLKPGVMLTERDGKTGLTLHGHSQFAKDDCQSKILRALSERPLSLEGLMATLSARDNTQSDNDNSLAIAEFILDFGDYIKA